MVDQGFKENAVGHPSGQAPQVKIARGCRPSDVVKAALSSLGGSAWVRLGFWNWRVEDALFQVMQEDSLPAHSPFAAQSRRAVMLPVKTDGIVSPGHRRLCRFLEWICSLLGEAGYYRRHCRLPGEK